MSEGKHDQRDVPPLIRASKDVAAVLEENARKRYATLVDEVATARYDAGGCWMGRDRERAIARAILERLRELGVELPAGGET